RVVEVCVHIVRMVLIPLITVVIIVKMRWIYQRAIQVVLVLRLIKMFGILMCRLIRMIGLIPVVPVVLMRQPALSATIDVPKPVLPSGRKVALHPVANVVSDNLSVDFPECPVVIDVLDNRPLEPEGAGGNRG